MGTHTLVLRLAEKVNVGGDNTHAAGDLLIHVLPSSSQSLKVLATRSWLTHLEKIFSADTRFRDRMNEFIRAVGDDQDNDELLRLPDGTHLHMIDTAMPAQLLLSTKPKVIPQRRHRKLISAW